MRPVTEWVPESRYFHGQKKAMKKLPLIILLFFIATSWAMAQHGAEAERHTLRHWRVAVVLGHTFVPAAHGAAHAAVPSWGLDLEYWLSERWGLGLHNDLEIESFIVKDGNGEEIEREYPLVFTLDLLWRPYAGWVLQLGPGMELETNENYRLLRFGLEYEFHLPHHWDIAPTFFYDSRQGAYDTWSLGLGVGKRF